MRDFPRRRRRRRRSAVSEARSLLRELPNLLKLLYRLIRDVRVPRVDKLLFGFVVAYVLTPADLLPDFLGYLGVVDDLYLVALALGRLLARAGDDVLLEHWDGNPHALGYLIEGVDQLGDMLPGPVRRILRASAEE
ncbi:MAG: DUF1232 domain-containing protein [Gemmatimonadetes bacterium]|nr:DUF1232 domain-containing protein [Gemmatimonadota bacterium]